MLVRLTCGSAAHATKLACSPRPLPCATKGGEGVNEAQRPSFRLQQPRAPLALQRRPRDAGGAVNAGPSRQLTRKQSISAFCLVRRCEVLHSEAVKSRQGRCTLTAAWTSQHGSCIKAKFASARIQHARPRSLPRSQRKNFSRRGGGHRHPTL